jgi:hypothetical protein
VDFRDYRDRLVTMDRMLLEGGVEAVFIQAAVTENAAGKAASASQLQRYARQSVLALRCNVARLLTGLSFRDFAVRAAESSLLQWFLPVKVTGPDADDIVFVEAALATADRTIVTGNLAHYPPEILNGVRVITPAQAAAELTRDIHP